MKRFSTFFITFIIVLPIQLGCRRSEIPSSQPTSAPASQPASSDPYAGSASCAECHEEAFEEWKDSHHALAQRELDPELDDVAFDPSRTIQHGSQTSYAKIQDGRYTITTMGNDGKPQTYEPTGVLGYDPLRQYLIKQPSGKIQVTELAYDPANKDWFDVYDQQDRQHWEWGHWTSRGMNWNSMCATCHNTDFKKNYDLKSDSYASTYRELGVGCEQCHGPMRDHVDWQELNPEQEGDPTIKPMTREQDFHVCGTCHARRGNLTETFKVGDTFLEHYEPILPDLSDTYYPDGQVWDEDFEYVAFSLSNMYAQGIRCVNCHYPHKGKIAVEGNELCQRCHAQPVTTKIAIDPEAHSFHPPDTPGFFCTDCHMPLTVYMARHWRHDHGMRIPDPLLTKKYGIPNACGRAGCHDDQSVDWSLEYVEKWYGQRMERPSRKRAELLAQVKEGNYQNAEQLLEVMKEQTNPNWRASCIKFMAAVIDRGPLQLSEAVRREMVKLFEDESPLVQAMAIETLEPLATLYREPIAEKLTSPHRLVRAKAAWAMRRWIDLDTLAGQDLLTRLQYNQDQPIGAFQWANYYADKGQHQKALPWFIRAIRWDPGAAVFRHSFAITLNALGRSEDAIIQLSKASDLEPQEAFYTYSLGLLYAEINRLPEACEALKATVARAPQQGRYWYNLGLAEDKLGQPAAAIEAISKAEELEPNVADYPFALATIYYKLRQLEQARQALERTLRINPNHQQALQMMHGQ